MSKRCIALTLISILVWITTVVSACFIAYGLVNRERAARHAVEDRTNHELDAASARLGGIISDVHAAVHELSGSLGGVPDTEAALQSRLEVVMKRHPALSGLGMAFAPFNFDGTRRLFAPVVERQGGALVAAHLEDSYDYTELYPWYRDAVKNGSFWSPPTADERSGDRVIIHSTLHSFRDGRKAVIFAMLPLKPLKDAVAHMDLGDHGYGMLLSADGRIMTHPDDSLARDLVPLGQAAKARGGYLARLNRAIETHESGRFKTAGLFGHPRREIGFRRIPETGWLVAAAVSRADLPVDRLLRHRDSLLLTALVVAALLLLPVLDRLIRGPVFSDWTWSIMASLVLVAGIGFIWHFNLAELSARVERGTVVTNAAALQNFRKRWLGRAILENQQLPRFVPTGVFVQSVEFITANNVVLTGYVWQRLKHAADGKVEQPEGIIMPEADTLEINEAYRKTEGDETVIGWYFRVTLRQTFNYSQFPFDWESVWIRLWPNSLDRNVILVPDLKAYEMMNPSTLPGVEHDLFIGGWSPVSSYFEYRINSYRANFGVDNRDVMQGRPELYFSILIRRNFLGPFISNLTPLILVLLLIFAMVMTIRSEARNRELLGFSAATIITTCAALFFAVLISHIDLRSSLEATRIFYLEYFYFITYGVILLVCVNSILFTRDKPMLGIHYRDNLLPKLLYWPLVLGAMFLVTLLVFL